MSSKRKRIRNTDTITISSSSSSSEASEDGVLESDEKNPSRICDSAAAHDIMSAKQTDKINSGRFGMFNRTTLIPRISRSLDSGKKRKKLKEHSGYKEKPRSGGSSSNRSQRDKLEVVMVDDDDGNEEDVQSLFIPDTSSQLQLVPGDDDPESDDAELYEDLPPERARKVKEYIHVLHTIERAEISLRAAKNKLSDNTAERTNLSQKLATIDTTADDKIIEIIRERDESIRSANEQAEQRIRRVKEILPAKKESYAARMQDCVMRRSVAEHSVARVEAEVTKARERKDELERFGGFELCSDVREVQAQKSNR